MRNTNPDTASINLAQDARHRLNEANSWMVVFAIWLLAFCAGGFVEGQQFHIIFKPYYVNDAGQIVGAKLFEFWATILSAMVITGLFIHFSLKWLLARAPMKEEGIRALMGLLMAIAAVMTPFIIYATFSANPLTSDGGGASHAVVLLRMPLVLGAVLLMGISVLGMQLALEMKRAQQREDLRLTDGLAASDNCTLAWSRERTQAQREKAMTAALFLEIAEATALAAQVRGDHAVHHASGSGLSSFAADVEQALDEALSTFHPEVQRLVAAAMPPAIPYVTLPPTQELSAADREALIDHGAALKTLSTNHALKEMKKCA